ncbi:PAAR domain-containing protein [Burkholderia ubonensis]|uniref:PAAR domain-containing protein n=1 Tax=Burkholderia ubonensis TaxID=101571 RepID=UPI000A6B0F81|nr:PAAR domain-containing protein [Burkholderia ubonensis]
MSRRAYIMQFDRTTSGGLVLDGDPDMNAMGRNFSYLYARVSCPVCNTTGFIAPSGERSEDRMLNREPALHGDICHCQCDPKPRVLASQDDMAAWT